jgi:hypothetical protein
LPSPAPSLAPSAATPLAGGGSSSVNSNGGAAASSSGGTPTATIIIIVVVAVVIIAATAAAYYFLVQKKEQHPALSFSEQYGVRPNQRDSFQGASPVYLQQQPRRSSVSASASASASVSASASASVSAASLSGGSQRYAQGDARKSLRLSVADVQPRSPSLRGQRPSIAHLAHTRQPSPWAGTYGDGSDL